ncbi:carbohydrate ABC transporter permease [Candidatus Phytoplasma pini]|uniref:ABC-type sugar transport system, permease component II n=1 Tax=Candidatus Phytoplasma pini TaxID=267362 RepID=A0A559KJZ3_9MOLU|nr:carbohydrate ABC transporter permease [Candidatus Phytoplasma pini]TVY12451.1 ABC-type sugar transport system, permease component II [Candidatus Phytoplasma pini]
MNNNKKIYFKKILQNIKLQVKKIDFWFITKYLFLILGLMLMILPFYLMIILSLKSSGDIVKNNVLSFPKEGWFFSNYTKVFSSDFLKYFKNTFIMVFFSTSLSLFLCILSAFALSILTFKSRTVILMLFVLSLMIPNEISVLFNYRTVSYFNWVNTGKDSSINGGVYLAMILPFLVNAVYVLLLINTFNSVPKELYYTSKIDGTTNWQYLWKILVPITKPTIIIIMIFRLVSAWNAYTWPELIGAELLTNMSRKAFDPETGIGDVNLQMASSVLINLPLLFVFIIFKNYIISGEHNSGIKG